MTKNENQGENSFQTLCQNLAFHDQPISEVGWEEGGGNQQFVIFKSFVPMNSPKIIFKL